MYSLVEDKLHKMKTNSNNNVNNVIVVLVFAFFTISLIMFAYTLYDIGVKTTGYASGYVNITVNTLVSINVTTSTVNWSSGTITAPFTNATLVTQGTASGSATNGNWSGTNAQAIVVANIGNVNASLAISGVKTAATFFGGTAAQQLYQWNVSNKEAGACGGGETSMKNTWANVNTSAATVCNQMDFHIDNNEIFIDFKLVVPYDATNTGVLSDIITISGNTAV